MTDKRICLLTGNETNCTDSCYLCGCGGEVALNDFYVPIYNIQRVCDIVKNMADVSGEGEEIAEYIRNELEKMTVCIENKAIDVQLVNQWISVNDSVPEARVNVLVTDGIHMMVTWCEYVDSQCLWVNNFYEYANVRFKEVTHWMPLPEFPKNLSQGNFID